MNNFFVYLISSTSKRIRLKYFASPWCLQSVQHDYTAILSCLIQTFPDQLEFKDLVQLTHRHDPEMDFFENMKHIQVGAAVSPAFPDRSAYWGRYPGVPRFPPWSAWPSPKCAYEMVISCGHHQTQITTVSTFSSFPKCPGPF